MPLRAEVYRAEVAGSSPVVPAIIHKGFRGSGLNNMDTVFGLAKSIARSKL
jgi:hypothetical protein